MTSDIAQAPPATPPTPIELFAIAIWGWTRAHPQATFAEFLDMLEQVERRVQVRPVHLSSEGEKL